jgi:hypothetical protein
MGIGRVRVVGLRGAPEAGTHTSLLEQSGREGDTPVVCVRVWTVRRGRVGLFGNAAPTGGKLHPTLNMGGRPIADKYREGKMKSTLQRALKECEIAEGEALPANAARRRSRTPPGCCTVRRAGPHELCLLDGLCGRWRLRTC